MNNGLLALVQCDKHSKKGLTVDIRHSNLQYPNTCNPMIFTLNDTGLPVIHLLEAQQQKHHACNRHSSQYTLQSHCMNPHSIHSSFCNLLNHLQAMIPSLENIYSLGYLRMELMHWFPRTVVLVFEILTINSQV